MQDTSEPENSRDKVGVTHLKYCCAPLEGNSMGFVANRACSFTCSQVLPFIVQDQSCYQAESAWASPLLNGIQERREGLGETAAVKPSQKEWSKLAVESGVC